MKRGAFWSAMVALTVLSGLFSGCSAPDNEEVSTATASLEDSDVTFDASLRGTGKASIQARVYANPGRHGVANVLAVHGSTTTGFTYEPLARAIFADRFLGHIVRRVIAINLPGHGDSGFPTNLPNGLRFGDLNLNDNVDVVMQAVDALRDQGIGPRVIIGHSAGGLEVQAMQETWLGQQSSLAAHGVSGVVLLSPVPPHGRTWQPGQGGSASVVNDPVLGTYFLLTPEPFIAGLFSTTAGQIVPAAPTPAEVIAKRYIGPEPLASLLQLVEAPAPLPNGEMVVVPRPTVSAGSFAAHNGTLLTLVSFSEDTAVPAGDLVGLYQYLTGDDSGRLDKTVTAPDAVHCMLVSNPTGLLEALRPML
jgi:pimeloyl-ACP methyl ester carboxylesterase